MKKANELLDKAINNLSEDDFRCWLCYVYGVMLNKMSKEDLELIENHLEQFLNEEKEKE